MYRTGSSVVSGWEPGYVFVTSGFTSFRLGWRETRLTGLPKASTNCHATRA
jgi:hypothetical protein